jgi:hypothetical protein
MGVKMMGERAQKSGLTRATTACNSYDHGVHVTNINLALPAWYIELILIFDSCKNGKYIWFWRSTLWCL